MSLPFFNQLHLQSEKPYKMLVRHGDLPTENFNTITEQIPVVNLRGFGDRLTLETTGFTVVNASVEFRKMFEAGSPAHHIRDPHTEWPVPVKICIKAHEDFLDAYLRSSWNARLEWVEIFEYSISDGNDAPPARGAHLDTTSAGLNRKIDKMHLKNTGDFLRHYFNVVWVNIWRTMDGPSNGHSLLLCDSPTLDNTDLVEVDVSDGRRVEKQPNVRYNPQQRWYCLLDHAPDEAIVFISGSSEGTALPAAYGVANNVQAHYRPQKSVKFSAFAFFRKS